MDARFHEAVMSDKVTFDWTPMVEWVRMARRALKDIVPVIGQVWGGTVRAYPKGNWPTYARSIGPVWPWKGIRERAEGDDIIRGNGWAARKTSEQLGGSWTWVSLGPLLGFYGSRASYAPKVHNWLQQYPIHAKHNWITDKAAVISQRKAIFEIWVSKLMSFVRR